MAMTDCNGKTVVRFDLWAVLGFLVLLVGIGMGYLFNAQAGNKAEMQQQVQGISDRVMKLEAKLDYLVDGIAELKAGQKELVVTLQKYNRAK